MTATSGRSSNSAKPTNSSRAARRLIAFGYAALLIAVIAALSLNLTEVAPIRSFMSNDWPLLEAQQSFSTIDQMFVAAAAGHNLALHIADDTLDQSPLAGSATILFFRASYAIYPQRVFVGASPPPINFPKELRQANVLPDDAWLKERDVRNVLTIALSPAGNLSTNLRPVK